MSFCQLKDAKDYLMCCEIDFYFFAVEIGHNSISSITNQLLH